MLENDSSGVFLTSVWNQEEKYLIDSVDGWKIFPNWQKDDNILAVGFPYGTAWGLTALWLVVKNVEQDIQSQQESDELMGCCGPDFQLMFKGLVSSWPTRLTDISTTFLWGLSRPQNVPTFLQTRHCVYRLQLVAFLYAEWVEGCQ